MMNRSTMGKGHVNESGEEQVRGHGVDVYSMLRVRNSRIDLLTSVLTVIIEASQQVQQLIRDRGIFSPRMSSWWWIRAFVISFMYFYL